MLVEAEQSRFVSHLTSDAAACLPHPQNLSSPFLLGLNVNLAEGISS